jgi:hypothetical protein
MNKFKYLKETSETYHINGEHNSYLGTVLIEDSRKGRIYTVRFENDLNLQQISFVLDAVKDICGVESCEFEKKEEKICI